MTDTLALRAPTEAEAGGPPTCECCGSRLVMVRFCGHMLVGCRSCESYYDAYDG